LPASDTGSGTGSAIIRLNKFIAMHTGVSRRNADEIIEEGRVVINGKK
jgi:16S rRNA uridine-516 pseudouridylate synthase and related pseudouridylate synthases